MFLACGALGWLKLSNNNHLASNLVVQAEYCLIRPQWCHFFILQCTLPGCVCSIPKSLAKTTTPELTPRRRPELENLKRLAVWISFKQLRCRGVFFFFFFFVTRDLELTPRKYAGMGVSVNLLKTRQWNSVRVYWLLCLFIWNRRSSINSG